MAKLPRVTAKIFASNAAEGDIGQYGSALAGNKLTTGDIAQIQALPAFLTGWRAAVLSTRNYPTLQEMNGLQKVFSQQIAYLFEHGIAEYDAASVYYAGDIIKVVTNGVPALKYSVIDNNLGNSVDNTSYWADLPVNVPLASLIAPGIVQPDGQTITINDGIISAVGAGANTDLSNLTSIGNAKFQYAPFSINSGSLDEWGGNNTLRTTGGTPSVITVEKYIVPQLSSNNSQYGICNDYTLTQTKSYSFSNFTNPWTIELAADNYIPAGAKVTWTMSTFNAGQQIEVAENFYYQTCGCSSGTITYTYTDDTQEVIYTHNGGAFIGARSYNIELPIANKTVKAIKWTGGGSVTGYNPVYADYYNAWGITFKAQWQETISSANTLICTPCTITTADGRTKTFENSSILDCSGLPDGSYRILKSYNDGSLTSTWHSNFVISKNRPQVSAGEWRFWLDNSKYPLSFNQYNGSEWSIINDWMYIADITMSSGAVTAVSNNPFNWNGVTGSSSAMPSNRYINLTLGASGSTYTAPADGWFFFYTIKSTEGFVQLYNMTINVWSESRTTYNNTGCGCYMPVKKGDVIRITYDGVNSNPNWKFHYADGN